MLVAVPVPPRRLDHRLPRGLMQVEASTKLHPQGERKLIHLGRVDIFVLSYLHVPGICLAAFPAPMGASCSWLGYEISAWELNVVWLP